MSNRQLGDGRIEITLEGRTAYLVPTLQACAEISSFGPGIVATIQKCEMFDFETICNVIGAGLTDESGKPITQKARRNDLPEAVAETGLFEMRPRAIEFCTLIANGGRMPPEDDDEDDDEDDGDTEDGEGDPLVIANSTA